MKELNELIDRYDVSCHCSAVYVSPKQDGHLVMYSDYASLAQRAEAAEAALAEEKRINSKLREDRAGLARECNAFEAKLAELEMQEPVGWMTEVEVDELHRGVAEEAYIYKSADAASTIPLFTRPAPAINLAELVPDEMPNGGSGSPTDSVTHWCDGYNSCRAAILRNIEEQSQ